MTGPEHYRKAEEALSILEVERDLEDWDASVRSGDLAIAVSAAHAHATLALAAATALGREGDGRMLPNREREQWFAVAGTPVPKLSEVTRA